MRTTAQRGGLWGITICLDFDDLRPHQVLDGRLPRNDTWPMSNELTAANYITVIAGTRNAFTPKSLRTFRVVIGGRYLMLLDTTPVLTVKVSVAATFGKDTALALADAFGGTVAS